MSDLTSLLRKKPTVKKTGTRKNSKAAKVIEIKQETVNIEQEDNIIVHLPIKVDTTDTQKSLQYTPDIEIPIGYEDGTEIYQHISQKNNPFKNSELTGIGPPPTTGMCQYPFDKKGRTENDVIDEEPIGTTTSVTFELLSDKEPKKHRENESHVKGRMVKSSVDKCLLVMEDANKSKIWPASVNVHCWWCCHPFEGQPCSIPYEFKDNKYNVYGVFCSPECAAAYNFTDTHGISDMWERYSLLNMLYRNAFDNKTYKIKLAPPRQSLNIFGGNLDIDEFRNNFTNNTHSYKIVMPPMVSIIPVQELSAIERCFTSKQDKNIIKDTDTLSLDTISQQSSGLRLKRNKPFLAAKNTLEKCMNLKKVEKENDSDDDYNSQDDISIDESFE
jgi:hypothetical protein